MYDNVTRDPAQLVAYPGNSRTHSDFQVSQIAGSIREWGFTNPILIDEHDSVIAGHGRIMAALKLGLAEVPCVVLAGLTDEQKKAYVIADNQLALNAGWDMDMLAAQMQELDASGFDLSLIGFEDLDALLDTPTEGLTDDDAVPEPPEEAITQPGDIWVLGNHRLMCGDSTSLDTVERLMDGALADVMITDPPYNVDYTGKTKGALKIKNDNKNDSEFRQFLCDAFTASYAALKPGASFYIWHADSEGYAFRGAAEDAGLAVRQCLIWVKDTLVMGRQDYHWKHEPCLYGWKDGAAHLWASDRKQTTLLEFSRRKTNSDHPTMKPVELIEYQLLNNTKGADCCLDLFGGSGTTLIACEKTNRNCYMMELDPIYCDVIVRRWQEYTGKQAVVADGVKFDERAPEVICEQEG